MRCECGDSECRWCGTAQGTRSTQNKPGGVLHVDLTRAEARISHAMMLVEDSEELRRLSDVHEKIGECISRLFGSAPRPKVGT